MQNYIKINRADNVCVALSDLKSGQSVVVDGNKVILTDDIERGHKFALTDFKTDDAIIKYGFPIGYAKENIQCGSHVHTHNIKTGLSDNISYSYTPSENTDFNSNVKEDRKFFMGYERSDGKVGVRNEIWIVPTVGCVNSIATAIAKECKEYECENIDAIVAFNHPYGCSQMGDDQENTRQALAGIINHPNAGGVLVLGLGCENSNIEVLKQYIGKYDDKRVMFLQCQDEADEIEAGTEIVKKLVENAKKVSRTKASIDRLIIGMKCGGSDGLSGISANPLVGRFSDMLTNNGGSTILTEVPEMFGAETILMDRCVNFKVFEKTVHLINDFKDYFRRHNQTIYENPSPGNKKGGISTLEDKALGCTQKSGASKVMDVLPYAKELTVKGLNLLCAPGNDLVASTALAISGAQIVLFTTGRGTPFACAVPTVKIASNSQLASKKSNWIDFDAGRLLADGMNMDILSEEFFDFVIDVANGRKVKSEEDGYRDLAIFKQGVTL